MQGGYSCTWFRSLQGQSHSSITSWQSAAATTAPSSSIRQPQNFHIACRIPMSPDPDHSMEKAIAAAPAGRLLQQPEQSPEAPPADINTLKLLSSKATWAIIVVNFVNHWGYFIYLNWMPSYFVKALGFNLRASSFLSFLPWTVMAVGSSAAGMGSQSTIPPPFPPGLWTPANLACMSTHPLLLCFRCLCMQLSICRQSFLHSKCTAASNILMCTLSLDADAAWQQTQTRLCWAPACSAAELCAQVI